MSWSLGPLTEEPVSLVCGVGNCNKQESADREAGSGSITWCQRTCCCCIWGHCVHARGQVSESASDCRPGHGMPDCKSPGQTGITLAHCVFLCAIFILRKAYFYDCLHPVWIFIISRHHCFERSMDFGVRLT